MPCKQLAKIIDGLNDDAKSLFEEYTSENDITKFMQFNVRSVPTLIVVDESGNELRRSTGMMTEDKLIEFIGA
jgi:thioredoxin-related protein